MCEKQMCKEGCSSSKAFEGELKYTYVHTRRPLHRRGQQAPTVVCVHTRLQSSVFHSVSSALQDFVRIATKCTFCIENCVDPTDFKTIAAVHV